MYFHDAWDSRFQGLEAIPPVAGKAGIKPRSSMEEGLGWPKFCQWRCGLADMFPFGISPAFYGSV